MKIGLLVIAFFLAGCRVPVYHNRYEYYYSSRPIEYKYVRQAYVLVPVGSNPTPIEVHTHVHLDAPPAPISPKFQVQKPTEPPRRFPTYDDIRWEQEHLIHIVPAE